MVIQLLRLDHLCPNQENLLALKNRHYLPKNIQKNLVRNFTVWGMITRPDQEYCHKMVAELRLLNHQEMLQLFPDATIEIEKIVGLEKSIIAIKNLSKIT